VTFDELQKTWQEQPIPDSVTIKEEMLLSITRRNQQEFLAAVLIRDFREVAVCVLLAVFFLHNYINSKSISVLIIAVGCLFVGSFFIIDRLIQKKRQPVYEDSLSACLRQSLSQVKHQIWLLRNILWWYLLPVGIGMLIGPLLEKGMAFFWSKDYVIVATFLVLIFYGIYRINQHAVLYGLLPRQNEIRALLNQLDPDKDDQTDSEPDQPHSKTNRIIDSFIAILFSILTLAALCFIVGSFISTWTQRQAVDINEFSNQSQQGATALADPNQHDTLIILEARYGSARHWIDVTQAVTEAVDGNSLCIHPTGDWGDPCFGKVKSLVVQYRYKGKQDSIQSQGWLQLPSTLKALNILDFSNQSQKVAAICADPNQHHKLLIIEARYGSGHHWHDVTELVTKTVRDNTLSISTAMANAWAGDPCYCIVKSIVVHYAYNGKQETIQSQGWLNLDLSTPPEYESVKP
jgi:hypothetical protein